MACATGSCRWKEKLNRRSIRRIRFIRTPASVGPCPEDKMGVRRTNRSNGEGRLFQALPAAVQGMSALRNLWDSHGRSQPCERGDSNPHGLLHWILSPARLPVPPLPRHSSSYPDRPPSPSPAACRTESGPVRLRRVNGRHTARQARAGWCSGDVPVASRVRVVRFVAWNASRPRTGLSGAGPPCPMTRLPDAAASYPPICRFTTRVCFPRMS